MNTSSEKKALRLQADIASINALAELLRRIAAAPSVYLNDNNLKYALRSQGSLAKYSLSELKIHGMSLNHQKAISEMAFGDFAVLDALRKSASDALANELFRSTRRNTTSKGGLAARVQELEKERTLLLQDLYVLQRAYDLRCSQARNYAQSADVATQVRCAKEQKELDASFSLRKKPIDTGKVTILNEAKKRVRKST